MYAHVVIVAVIASMMNLVVAENPKFLSKHPNGRKLQGSINWDGLNKKDRFSLWRKVFRPSYDDEHSEFGAFEAFKTNDLIIDTHNEDPSSSYRLGHNEFSDLTLEQFQQHMGLKLPVRALRRKKNVDTTLRVTSSTPSSVDWVEKGAVTDVKNQGQCGSCWSFSTTGAIEGAYFVNGGDLTSLSEQQLVSCDKTDSGCSGGLMDYAFAWVKDNGGLCSESDYSYTSSEGSAASCETSCTAKVTVTGYTDVTQDDEKALKAAVAQQPVSVAIEADQSSFQLYESGVYTSSDCGTSLDHGVLIVGYGEEDDTDYWKVKNSWGTSWGEDGYIRLERGVNMCGISQMASYPTGAKTADDLSEELSVFETAMRQVYADVTPSGTYSGSKSVVGQSITATIKFEDDSHFDFAISGAASIDCDDESFTLSDGTFNIPGATTSGDCLEEALDKNNVDLSSVTYDATSDEITVSVKYEGFLKISVVLNKQSSVKDVSPGVSFVNMIFSLFH
jgi:C1A family cysteine protease